MAIFDGEDGVLEHFGYLAVGDDNAAFEREAPDHRAVVRIKLRHDVRAIIFELPHLRQVRRVDEDHPAQRAYADREQQQGEEHELTENPAAENRRGSRPAPSGTRTHPVFHRKPRISHSTPSLRILGPQVATVKPGTFVLGNSGSSFTEFYDPTENRPFLLPAHSRRYNPAVVIHHQQASVGGGPCR